MIEWLTNLFWENFNTIVLSLNLASVFLILAVVFSYFRRNKTGENLILQLAKEHVEYLKAHQGCDPDESQNPSGKKRSELDKYKSRSQKRRRKT